MGDRINPWVSPPAPQAEHGEWEQVQPGVKRMQVPGGWLYVVKEKMMAFVPGKS